MNDHKATRRDCSPPVADVHLSWGAFKCCIAYKINVIVNIFNSSKFDRICHPPIASRAFTAQEVT